MEHLPASTTPLSWIHKRDGRLVPFDPDKISRSLFAAGETLGRSDPFQARELSDSVLHFLTTDAAGTVTNTAQIAELVVKVVRELGQPALSRAYQEGQAKPKQAAADGKSPAAPPPGAAAGPSVQQMEQWLSWSTKPGDLARRVVESCLRDFSLAKVFSRDLVSAHYQGLITLHALEMPLELAGMVLPASGLGASAVIASLRAIRGIVGGYVAIAGPEYLLAENRSLDDFVQGLVIGLGATGLRAIVNLNGLKPPAAMEWLGDGPLFASHRTHPSREEIDVRADALCERLVAEAGPEPLVRIDWHLAGRDFSPNHRSRLGLIARRILEGAPIALVMDRPQKPEVLAEGLDAKSTALLFAVDLNLARLIGQMGTDDKPDTFMQKLGSLCRLALSACVQKREFLRHHAQDRPELTGRFLLARARLLVVPNGLAAVTDTLFRARALPLGQTVHFTKRVIDHLVRGLREEGRMRALETCVEVLPEALGEHDPTGSDLPPTWGMGTLSWQPPESIEEAVESAGNLHSLCGSGTLHISFSESALPTVEDLMALLEFAWNDTSIIRLRFHRSAQESTQLAAPWVQASANHPV
jgi:hypothetical protein